jgi:glyoxylase-like metal-dependent hydrolase (beta-lactamase superfamily II)
MFSLAGVPAGAPDGVTSTLLTGDVLFAGSIGRTDLPGGDHAVMLRSLRDRVLPLPDDTWVLPGHGPDTTIARERATNPFLRDLHPGVTASS